jgi:hypothetical protein
MKWKCEYIKKQLRRIAEKSPDLAKKIDEQYGFLSEKDVQRLSEIDQFWQVLVRCGGGRVLTAAQNVQWFTSCITQSGDYVRDYGLCVDDFSLYK